MGLENWFIVGVVLLFSSALQSIAGIGFTMLAMPLLLLFVPVDFVEVVVICITGSTLQKILAVGHLGKHVDWKILFPMIDS